MKYATIESDKQLSYQNLRDIGLTDSEAVKAIQGVKKGKSYRYPVEWRPEAKDIRKGEE